MGRYLEKFLSSVPERQSRQALEILGKLKDKGTIRSIKEYSEKLQALTAVLKSTDPEPTFNFFQAAVGNEIDSEIHNTMTEAAAMDIETAFQEAQNIGRVLEMHKNVFKVTVFENLRKSIRELSKKIDLYQYLEGSYDGFAYSQFNTFDETGYLTPRTDPLVNSLYFDYNKNEAVPAEEDAQINTQAQNLILSNIGSRTGIVGVDVGEDTTASVINIADPKMDMQNIIDGEENTFWVFPIIRERRETGGVVLQLRLDLGGVRNVNSIYIDAASEYPMILKKIAYLPQSPIAGVPTATVFTGSQEITLPTQISFPIIAAQFIELTFRQYNWEETRYWITKKEIPPDIGVDMGVQSNEGNDITTDDSVIHDALKPDAPSDLTTDTGIHGLNDTQLQDDIANAVGWEEAITEEDTIVGGEPVIDMPIDTGFIEDMPRITTPVTGTQPIVDIPLSIEIHQDITTATETVAVKTATIAQAAAEAGAFKEAIEAAQAAAAVEEAVATGTAAEAVATATNAIAVAQTATDAIVELGAITEAEIATEAAMIAEAAAQTASAILDEAMVAQGITEDEMAAITQGTKEGSSGIVEQGWFGKV